jgi:hypothetical protein
MFVVTSGVYSDYRLCGVYSTREKAEGALEAFVDSRVEELPIDQELPQGKFWEVWMTRYGETGPCDFRQVNYDREHKPIVQCAGGGFLIYVFGKDIQHAAKVANELRIQWLKENSA